MTRIWTEGSAGANVHGQSFDLWGCASASDNKVIHRNLVLPSVALSLGFKGPTPQ